MVKFVYVFHSGFDGSIREKELLVVAINRMKLIEIVVYLKLMLVVDPKLSKPSTFSLFK